MSKRRLAQILILAAIAFAGWTGYRERLRITAWVWHVRHGGVLKFGNYLVPVPANWYVMDYGTGDQILIRLDHARETFSNGPRFPAAVSLLEGPPVRDISYWESFVTSNYKKRGTDAVLKREFNLNSDTLHCIGGNALPATEARQVPIGISWDCMSSGTLEVMIIGQEDDLDEAWGILSHIRISSHKRP